MNYTTNYNLKKPAGTDNINIADFNNNADTIDTTLKSVSDTAAAKYSKPATGIPETDLAEAVQTKLNEASGKYSKPATGIPETDLAAAVQTKLNSVSDYVNPYSEGETVTPSGEVEQKTYEAYTAMIEECEGDFYKIPFLLQTDNHNTFPTNIYNLCGKMVNFSQISRMLTLGDEVANYFNETHLISFANGMKPFPIEKRVDVAGNHDIWATSTQPRTYIDQARLSPYFKNYASKRGGTNGYLVSYDDYFKVKYLVANSWDGEAGSSSGGVSTEQANFLIEELSKNDGYDIVLLSHSPIYMSDASSTMILPALSYNMQCLGFSQGFNNMLIARKNKTSGTYTDDDSIEHSYDFTDCNTDFLCSFHGHQHPEGYSCVSGSYLKMAFGAYFQVEGNPFYFGYIDRKNRLLKYWRSSTGDDESVSISLDYVALTGVSCEATKTIAAGTTEQLALTFAPTDASLKRMTWTSSDTSVATVNSIGRVTGVAAGTATITGVSTEGSHSVSCVVTVEQAIIPVSSITLSSASVSVYENHTSTITATVLPANATNPNVVWSTSDSTKATVVGGVITAIAEGSATITCTAADGSGVSATCAVTVLHREARLPAEYQEVEYLESNARNVNGVITSTSLQSGDTIEIKANYYASNDNDSICGKQSAAQIYVKTGVFCNYANVQLVSPTVGTACSTNTDYEFEISVTNSLTNLVLMAYNTDYKYGMRGKMYYATFYRNNVKIYDFVPCYRKSDSALGFYDIVNNVFAIGSGTATFVAGPNV